MVRENRSLYKASPKHAKLAIARHIVHTITERGGLFLERDRLNGTWHPVSFDRAVQKTSQSLRERYEENPRCTYHRTGENDSTLRRSPTAVTPQDPHLPLPSHKSMRSTSNLHRSHPNDNGLHLLAEAALVCSGAMTTDFGQTNNLHQEINSGSIKMRSRTNSLSAEQRPAPERSYSSRLSTSFYLSDSGSISTRSYQTI